MENKPQLYQIKETERFLSKVSKVIPSIKRWDEIRETIDCDIARNPHRFEDIPGTELKAVTLLSEPPLTLYFTIDDEAETIILQDLY